MYTTGHMLRDEVIALHAFAAQCHGVQTMRVFNVYPNSKYTVVWGPRHGVLMQRRTYMLGVVSCSESFDGFIAHMHFSPYNAYQIFLSVDALLCSHALG